MQLPHPAFAQAEAVSALPRPAEPVEIRLATAADAGALIRLAQLDSALAAAAELPDLARDGDLLVAESEGDLVAALSLRDGLLVSDPFHRTSALIALLRTRRVQVERGARSRRRDRVGALRPRHS